MPALRASRPAPWALVACCLMLTACGSDDAPHRSAANPFADYVSANYEGLDNWMCHPELAAEDDVCRADLDTVAVSATGDATTLPFTTDDGPAFDCFYLYPTASLDPGENSDFRPGPQETGTTRMQFARYGEHCRTFAPVYRQRTLTSLALSVALGFVNVSIPSEGGALAYEDAVDAFKRYVARDNDGRGFILVGHSQGAGLLRRIIAEIIENEPYLHERLISAHLLGTSVAVPVGADVGADFQRTPACRHPEQTGCVVSFASFRADDPNLDSPRFGITGDAQTQALCTNPAALAGGESVLDARIPFRLPPVFQLLLIPRGSGGPYQSRLSNVALSEPFYAVPGQILGECVVDGNGTSYLEVRIQPEPDGPRADDYPGEFLGGTGWGLHLADVNIAQGDLVSLAGRQGRAWLQR